MSDVIVLYQQIENMQAKLDWLIQKELNKDKPKPIVKEKPGLVEKKIDRSMPEAQPVSKPKKARVEVIDPKPKVFEPKPSEEPVDEEPDAFEEESKQWEEEEEEVEDEENE